MTEEELKNKLISEAQASWNKLNITKRACGSEFSYYDGYIDCGTIKEKQIQIDAEQIRALQKQNGELTDELKALRESVKNYGAGCYENGLRNGRRSNKLTEAKEIIREYIRLSLQEDKDIDANVKLFQKAETFIKE